jgi:hypothetical protein
MAIPGAKERDRFGGTPKAVATSVSIKAVLCRSDRGFRDLLARSSSGKVPWYACS